MIKFHTRFHIILQIKFLLSIYANMTKCSAFRFLLLSIFFLVSLTGCFRAAYDPFYITPDCPTDAWNPCPDNNNPIPPYYLLWSCDAYIEKECFPQEPLHLTQLVDLAIKNSNELRETWADTRTAAAQYGQSLAPYFPEITLEGYYEAIREGSFFGGGAIFIDKFMEWGPYVSISWLLFDSGTTAAQSESYRQMVWSANWSHNQEIQNVLQTTITDYYTYIASREQVVASEANLADAATTLDMTIVKHEFGISDYTDELQAETQVAKMELELLTSEQDMFDFKTALIADLGLPANTPVQVADPLEKIDLEKKLPPLDCFVSEAYIYRPDLFASYAQVLSNLANVEAARRQQWVQLQMNGTYGDSFFQNGQSDKYNYSLLFELSLPLFKGFDYLNQVRQAKAELSKSQAQMRQLEIQIIQEVTTYYQNFVIATEKVKVNRYYVEVATASFQASLKKYQAGTIDYTTVVNTLTQLADARYSLAVSKKDWYTSLTDLAYSTGTLSKPCS